MQLHFNVSDCSHRLYQIDRFQVILSRANAPDMLLCHWLKRQQALTDSTAASTTANLSSESLLMAYRARPTFCLPIQFNGIVNTFTGREDYS